MDVAEIGTAPAEHLQGDSSTELSSERYFDGAVSPEEIDRLTVAENLSDVNRAQLYAAGDPAQQRALIDNLAGLVSSSGPAALVALAGQLPQLAASADEEGEEALAQALAASLRGRKLPSSVVADLVLPLALPRASSPFSSSQLQDAWAECFGEMVLSLEREAICSRILPAALALVRAADVPARCLGCRLLSLLAPALSPDGVEGLLLGPLMALCQDSDCDVRRAAGLGLPGLARALAGRGSALEAVARELLLLLEDEEVGIRSAAWGILAELLWGGDNMALPAPLLPAPARRAALALFLQQCRVPDPHVEMHRSLAAVFGPLMARLVGDMEGDPDVNTCLSGFRNLAWRHDAPTRLNCAAGLAGVLRVATPRRYASHLHDTLLRLASDQEVDVRRQVAGALHEVVALLGRERCVQYLRPTLLALLGDESRDVQAALAANLGQLLEQFYLPFNQNLCTAFFGELVPALLKLEEGSGHDWRLQLAWLRLVAELPKFYPAEVLHNKFLPAVLKHMGIGSTAALLGAAADAAASIWRAPNSLPHLRTALYRRLVREFAQGRSCWQRAAYVEFCGHALRRFSSSFFKAHLMDSCSLLAFDPVPGVQLRVCELMPALKQTISLPQDLAHLEKLNAAMSYLLTASTRAVAGAARRVHPEYKQQAVRTPRGPAAPAAAAASGGGDASAAAAAARFEQDDALKQLWEKDFVFEQQELERIHADIQAHDKTRRPPPTAALALPLPLPTGGPPSSCHLSSSSSSSRSRSSSNRSGSFRGAIAGSRGGKPAIAAAGDAHRRTTSDPTTGGHGKPEPEAHASMRGHAAVTPAPRAAPAPGSSRAAARSGLRAGRQPAAAGSTADQPRRATSTGAASREQGRGGNGGSVAAVRPGALVPGRRVTVDAGSPAAARPVPAGRRVTTTGAGSERAVVGGGSSDGAKTAAAISTKLLAHKDTSPGEHGGSSTGKTPPWGTSGGLAAAKPDHSKIAAVRRAR